MANEQRGASPDETNVASTALRIIIALVAAAGSVPFVTLFFSIIMGLASGSQDGLVRFVWLVPVAMCLAMIMAALLVFVSAVATMILSALVVAPLIVWWAPYGGEPSDWSFFLLLFGAPAVVLALSTLLATMGGGRTRRSTEPRFSLPLVGAAIIGSAFGIYQSIASFDLISMLCAAVSIAILKWPRFAWWLAGFVVLVAALRLAGFSDAGPRVAPAFPVIWLFATAVMLPLVYLGRRELDSRRRA